MSPWAVRDGTCLPYLFLTWNHPSIFFFFSPCYFCLSGLLSDIPVHTIYRSSPTSTSPASNRPFGGSSQTSVCWWGRRRGDAAERNMFNVYGQQESSSNWGLFDVHAGHVRPLHALYDHVCNQCSPLFPVFVFVCRRRAVVLLDLQALSLPQHHNPRPAGTWAPSVWTQYLILGPTSLEDTSELH